MHVLPRWAKRSRCSQGELWGDPMGERATLSEGHPHTTETGMKRYFTALALCFFGLAACGFLAGCSQPKIEAHGFSIGQAVPAVGFERRHDEGRVYYSSIVDIQDGQAIAIGYEETGVCSILAARSWGRGSSYRNKKNTERHALATRAELVAKYGEPTHYENGEANGTGIPAPHDIWEVGGLFGRKVKIYFNIHEDGEGFSEQYICA